MLSILCAGCLSLSPAISMQFALKYASLSEIAKTLFLGFNVIQGRRCWHLRKARQQCLLIRSTFVSICNRSHARRANSGNITIS